MPLELDTMYHVIDFVTSEDIEYTIFHTTCATYEFNEIPITLLITFSTELNPKIYITKGVT